MKFSRLRIHGFKTFVEPTEFLIEPGLTGVVGPNGCGKSNLMEALRWVMGESSFKNMRASGMEDVIFSGSGSRPARNMAEVVLSVDNRQRLAPAAFNDADVLEVSRRIEREAGSTYRINGREVRARDVQLLFADASTGARSPALVRQGQIGEIVNAKPQARRRVLEEAAGIAGLHARRHEAETRLRAAEANLTRVDDVIGQIETQVENLKRQARQAIRYRALSSDLRKNEAMLALVRHKDTLTQRGEAQSQLEAEQRGLAGVTADQAEAARLQAIAAHHLPALREDAASAGAALQRLVIAREQLEAEEKRNRERLDDLTRRIAQMQDDRVREERALQDAKDSLARVEDEEKWLQLEAEAVKAQNEGAKAALAAEQQAVEAEDKAYSAANAALAEAKARRAQCERQIADGAQRVQRLTAQRAELAREKVALEESSDAPARRDRLITQCEEAQALLAEREAAALACEQALNAARANEQEARRPLAEADKAVQALDTEIRTLTKLLFNTKDAAFPPALDQISVAKGYEAALGAALGDDLDAPLDGKAPIHWAGAEHAGDPSLPDGVDALFAHVQAPPALHRRLKQIGLVTRTQAAALRPFLKPGQRLVTREGDLWRWDGFTMAANAPSAAARRLAEKNRLADLTASLEAARAQAETQRQAAQAAQIALQQAQRAEDEARLGWRAQTRALESLRQELAQAEKACGQIVARLSALAEADLRLASSLEEAAAFRADAENALASLGEDSALEAALEAARQSLALQRARLAEAQAKHQLIAHQANTRTQRLAVLAKDRAAWRERMERAQSHFSALGTRLTEAEGERKTLMEAPDTILARRHALTDAIDTAKAEKLAKDDRLAEGERAASETDRTARAALDALSKAREQIARAEARVEAAQARLDDLVRSIEEAFEAPLASLARIADLGPEPKLPPVPEIEKAIDHLKRERERLGGVNLRADEELQEAQAQFDRLTGERDDLIEAIRTLRNAILSLNREGRERLLASFNVVNANFQRLFTGLFGGGTAELQLIESDDPLEAGLDILARPPGKKPQTLSLLSGGEQALTAIALIFAVFLTNPAPICVLDEVDAPLDDANVERYCDLIATVAAETGTRFIVITHNPITMSRMDRLFGVTMAERGMSQLVSVDLGVAERLAAE